MIALTHATPAVSRRRGKDRQLFLVVALSTVLVAMSALSSAAWGAAAPSGHGNERSLSLEQTAQKVTRDLTAQGYQVERGYPMLVTQQDRDRYTFPIMEARYGNNPASPYVVLVMKSWEDAQAQSALEPAAHVGETTNTHNVPQEFVVCTGWHALCTASPDCKMNGDKADCDCMRVNEAHIVETSAIQDPAVKHLTLARCTAKHPCDVDHAPVCKAIKHGNYTVHDVRYDWVSTYSYRGWCSLLTPEPIPCDQQAIGYTGDLYWAVCDGAPCTENQNPSDPERPLSCQCRVENIPFVGPKGSCTGEHGGIISSFPMASWDFQNKTYPFPMPGYEYVQGACAPLKSDPFTEHRRRDSESR